MATLARTPAFNLSLQVGVPDGQRIPQETGAFYDRAVYDYWAARLWFDRYRFAGDNADIGETADTVVSETATEEALEQALVLIAQSLAQNPGDPAIWFRVARMEMAAGNRKLALQALLNTYELAPFNSVLATQRTGFLVEFMAEQEGRDIALETIAPEMVRSDLEVMRARFDRLSDSYAENAAIGAFLERAD